MGYDALWIISHALRIYSCSLLRKLDPWKYVLSSIMIDWFVIDLTKFVCKILFNNENKILIKEKKLVYLTKTKKI